MQALQIPRPQHQRLGPVQLLEMHLDPQVAALGFQHPQALPLGPQAPLELSLGPLQPLEGSAAMLRWDLLVSEQLPHLVHHLPLVEQLLVSQSTLPVSNLCWGWLPYPKYILQPPPPPIHVSPAPTHVPAVAQQGVTAATGTK